MNECRAAGEPAAYLIDASERDPVHAEFTDLMTASLGALLIEQELRVLRESKERPAFRRDG